MLLLTTKPPIMKKYLFLFAVSLIAFTACEEKIDIEKEKESIKTVIEQLIIDRAELDFEGYINNWVNDPYTFIASSGKDGYNYSLLEEFKKQTKEEFAKILQTQKEGGYSISMELVDFTIKVYEETAWAHCKNKWTKVFTDTEEKVDMGESFLVFSLEKHDQGWQIAFVSAFTPSSLYTAESETDDTE